MSNKENEEIARLKEENRLLEEKLRNLEKLHAEALRKLGLNWDNAKMKAELLTENCPV